jgi:hypothetical protein
MRHVTDLRAAEIGGILMFIRRKFLALIGGALCGASLSAAGAGAADARLPSFPEVQQVVRATLAGDANYRPGDLISLAEGRQLIESLAKMGWTVGDKKAILDKMLPDSHTLVQTLRTPKGRAFMHKVARQTLIYDRLDRVSQQYGGRQLVRDLVKLPDAERYARRNPGRGVPGLVDFLPKRGNGKRPTIKDYDKPTGKIYTETAFIERLKISYAAAQEQRASHRR